MTNARWILLAAVSSCALPRFGIVDSFDDATGGSSGTAGNQSMGGKLSSGGSSAGTSTEGGEGEPAPTSGAPAGGKGGVAGAGGAGTGTSGAAGAGTTAGAAGANACLTPPQLDFCPVGCADLKNDPLNCGTCAKKCDPNESCSSGACTCAAPNITCNNACFPNHTAEHCGSCQKACVGAEDCTNDVCKVCATGCAVLTLTQDSAFIAYFSITFNPPLDFNKANLTFRVHGPAGASLALSVNTASGKGFGDHFDFEATPSWQDWVIPVYDKLDFSDTNQIKLGVGFSQAAHSAATSVYIDTISIDNNAFMPLKFTANATPLLFDQADSTGPGTVTWTGN